MQRFLDHHDENILGVLTGFDRIVFRGSLRNLSYVDGMGGFLGHHGIRYTQFGDFAQRISERLRSHAHQYAEQHGRPYLHLDSPRISKEEQAAAIGDADGIEEGLVCVFGCVEQCMTYEYTPRKDRSGPWLRRRIRQCLFVYFYYMDREFGLTYVRLQTWLPMDIQIGVNGREYLARRMDRAGMDYEKRDNCFTRIGDVKRAQKMLDSLIKRKWSKFLNRLAREVNPHLGPAGGLDLTGYYWTFRETEVATDIMYPVSQRTKRAGRPYRALRPIDREEARVFQAVLQGGFALQGFRNKDIRHALYGDDPDEAKRKRLSGRVTRLLSLLRSHKLIKKVSHTLYYRVTKLGQHLMSTALRLRNLDVALVGSN